MRKMAKRILVGTDVYITDLTTEQRRQLVADLAKLRAAGAPDNTAAVCLAVHEAAFRLHRSSSDDGHQNARRRATASSSR